MISPWKSGFGNPSTMSCTGPIAMVAPIRRCVPAGCRSSGTPVCATSSSGVRHASPRRDDRRRGCQKTADVLLAVAMDIGGMAGPSRGGGRPPGPPHCLEGDRRARRREGLLPPLTSPTSSARYRWLHHQPDTADDDPISSNDACTRAVVPHAGRPAGGCACGPADGWGSGRELLEDLAL